MPRQLKRRSDAISRDRGASESEDEPPRTQRRQRPRSTSSEPPPPTQRRRRDSSAEDSDAASSRASPDPLGYSTENILIKKLVRLALATEYSRTPLRRSDITAKIFKDANTAGNRISFQKIFDGAQKVLGDTFGMEMFELPSKEKTTLKDRRTQATQEKRSGNTSSKSWILVSKLPAELKTNPILTQPTLAPDSSTEANYTALYTFILSLIYLNSSSITDQKLERYLKRVNAETYTPLGNKDKLLQRMMKEGYVERRRDTTSGQDEVIEWVPGPRGKVEVGVQGVMGLVRTVYGYGAVELHRGEPNQRRRRNDDVSDDDEEEPEEPTGRLVKIEEDELNAKLSRSLGIKIGKDESGGRSRDRSEEEDERRDRDDGQPGPSRRGGGGQSQRNRQGKAASSQVQGRGTRRRHARDDDDDDDESD
ncbi:hypothetical protein H2200_008461 [Cladophialophora chaetospira]|uniref:MAGE domain-containing protein n=1 Tax=Cladophialophora chaetospira TaxID=386627 RepID=A0AA39CGM3_9EURO|nr:hypothetical protein H2200_008461 [Cladophialophora chaetospira]